MFRNRNVESNRIGRGCLRTMDAHDLLPTNWLDSEGIDDLLRNTRDRCSRVQQGRERSLIRCRHVGHLRLRYHSTLMMS